MHIDYAPSADICHKHLNIHFKNHGRNAVVFEVPNQYILLFDVTHQNLETFAILLDGYPLTHATLYAYGGCEVRLATTIADNAFVPGLQHIERHDVDLKLIRVLLERPEQGLFHGNRTERVDRYAITMLATLLQQEPVFEIKTSAEGDRHIYTNAADAMAHLEDLSETMAPDAIIQDTTIRAFHRNDQNRLVEATHRLAAATTFKLI